MGVQAVVSADAVAWATGYLRTRLSGFSGIYVGTDTPEPLREWTVTLRRDGGPRVDAVQDVVRLGVNAWAATEYDLMNGTNGLASLVRAHLLVAAGNGPVTGVREVSGPMILADASQFAHAYMTFEVVALGVGLT